MSKDFWEDDQRLGVPNAGSRALHPTTTRPDANFDHHAADERPADNRGPADLGEPQLRAGDSEIGRPHQVPSAVSPLSDDDRRRLREAEEQQALRELSEAEELLASDPSISWLGWFTHPLAAAFLIGTAGCLGLFLYSQTTSILTTLASQPPLMQGLGYAALSLCGLAILYAAGRLLFLYVRLKRNQQIRVAGLEELQVRTRLRWLANSRAAEARTQLETYLRTYPIQTPRERKRLEAGGVTEVIVADLLKAREHLLDPAKFTTTIDWFEQFRAAFQSRLDEAAEGRVRYWAKRTGMVTALAPNALVDSAASLYFGFAMLADLCLIYNLRAGRTGTAVLLGRVFFQSYLAGQFNEWEKLTEEQLNHLVAPGGPLYELAAARIFSKVGAKAATGMLNYFLIGRLGRYTCRLLRPVTLS